MSRELLAYLYPRCRHAYPEDGPFQVHLAPDVVKRCERDAPRFLRERGGHGRDRSLMDRQHRPDGMLVGLLGEEVFSTVCGVPRRREWRAGRADFPGGLDVKTRTIEAAEALVHEHARPYPLVAFVLVSPATRQGWLHAVLDRLTIQVKWPLRRFSGEWSGRSRVWPYHDLARFMPEGECMVCRAPRGQARVTPTDPATKAEAVSEVERMRRALEGAEEVPR